MNLTRQKEFNSDSEKPRTNTNKSNHPNCRSSKLNQMNRLVWFSQPVQMVEKIFKKSSESSLQSQEYNKINGVQFRLQITKNQHKQIKPPKLSFQQTEPNEPVGLVSQPVQMVDKIFKKSSESSLQSQESNKTNGVQFRLRITKNQHKQIKPPKLPLMQTEPNEPAGLVFPTGPDG